jgi:hypothetical protein
MCLFKADLRPYCDTNDDALWPADFARPALVSEGAVFSFSVESAFVLTCLEKTLAEREITELPLPPPLLLATLFESRSPDGSCPCVREGVRRRWEGGG